MNSGNACYNVVQNHLPSCMLLKNVQTYMQNYSFTCGSVWNLSLISREEHGDRIESAGF
jgi:hypothetical protein